MGTGMISSVWALGAQYGAASKQQPRPAKPKVTPKSNSAPAAVLIRDIWSVANIDIGDAADAAEATLNTIKEKFDGRVCSPLNNETPLVMILSPEELADELKKERMLESKKAAIKARKNIVDDEMCETLMKRLDHMPTPTRPSNESNPFSASTCRVPGYILQKLFRIAHDRTKIPFEQVYKTLPQSIKDEISPNTLHRIISGNEGCRGNLGVPFPLMKHMWECCAQIPDWKQPVVAEEYFQPPLYSGKITPLVSREIAKIQVSEALRNSNIPPEKFKRDMMDKGIPGHSLKKVMTSLDMADSMNRRTVAYLLANLQAGSDLAPFTPSLKN